MKRLLLALLLFTTPALAQNPGVTTQGAVTANDCVKFINRNLIASNGAACAGATSPGGSSGQVQYNNAGAFAGASGLTTSDGIAFTASGVWNFSNSTQATTTANGALFTAGGIGVAKNAVIGGTVVTGNTGVDTSLSANWFYSGSVITGYAAGGQVVTINSGIGGGGGVNLVNQTGVFRINTNTILSSPSSGVWTLGAPPAASPVANTLTGQASRAGTDNNTGGAGVAIQSGTGTGVGTVSTLTLQSPVAVASGTGVQTQTTGWRINNGAAASTGYTVATLPAVALTGARAHVTDQLTACAATGVALTGGGAVTCPAFYNGAAWVGG